MRSHVFQGSLYFYVRVAFVSESLMDLCEHSSVSLPDFFRGLGVVPGYYRGLNN